MFTTQFEPLATVPTSSGELAQLPLKDIHLPAAVSWWPPAPGWWALPLLLAFAAAGAWWVWSRTAERRRRRRLVRRARAELDRIEADYQASGDPARMLEELSICMRRAAMSIRPRREVAGVCGERWAAWLINTVPCRGLDALELLVDGPYRRSTDDEARSAAAACRIWLERAGRNAPGGEVG